MLPDACVCAALCSQQLCVWLFRCSVAPRAMAPGPEDDGSGGAVFPSGAGSIVVQWQCRVVWTAPWGTPPGAQLRPGSYSSTMNLSVTCRLPPAVLPLHRQTTPSHPHPLMFLTLPVWCSGNKKDGSSGFQGTTHEQQPCWMCFPTGKHTWEELTVVFLLRS